MDSTTGVQMAYVKAWAARSFRPLELRPPVLLAGPGEALRGDACTLAGTLDEVDLAYLDPPYNQHRYYTNYHVWETLVAWDAPEHYGVACKRVDARDPATHTAFNSKRTMAAALAQVVADVRWRAVGPVVQRRVMGDGRPARSHVRRPGRRGDPLIRLRSLRRGPDRHLQPGRPAGGSVSHLKNREYLVVAGPPATVRRAAAGLGPTAGAGGGAAKVRPTRPSEPDPAAARAAADSIGA